MILQLKGYCFFNSNKYFVLVKLEENQKRKDYLSWDEYFMSAAFLTAMRSKVSVSLLNYLIVHSKNNITIVFKLNNIFVFIDHMIYALSLGSCYTSWSCDR